MNEFPTYILNGYNFEAMLQYAMKNIYGMKAQHDMLYFALVRMQNDCGWNEKTIGVPRSRAMTVGVFESNDLLQEACGTTRVRTDTDREEITQPIRGNDRFASNGSIP